MRKPMLSVLAVAGVALLAVLGHAALVSTAAGGGSMAATASATCAACHAG